MDTDGFPRALLNGPPAERLAYFKRYTVAHPLLIAADAALRRAIGEPADAALIFVFGPAGVGKTTLRHRLAATVPVAAEMHDPGHIPIVAVEAVAPDSGAFNWKDYYLRVLRALDDPFIGQEGARLRGARQPENWAQWPGGRSVAAPTLRRALEQALWQRRPAALVVDEAQHLLKMASGRRLQDQLDTLKSLASLTQTVHVLIGTYDVLAWRNLSGQLSRRSLDIHFPRYQCSDSGHVRAFKSVLWAFQRHLPLAVEPDLVRQWAFCYERSIGCVGTLKAWLVRGLAATLEQDQATLSAAHLARVAPTVAQCVRMAADAREGEQTLDLHETASATLQALLGIEIAARGVPAPAAATRSPVGQRAPTRDPVAGESHGG
jgi:AAA domain